MSYILILVLSLKQKLNFKWRYVSVLILFSIVSQNSHALSKNKHIKYKTFFGNCPSRSAGTFTLKMAKAFEENHSLYDLKKTILKEKLNDRHFLSKYEIRYSPVRNLLEFDLDCPVPLMKVQIYKSNGTDYYDAILTDQATLVDPTYEVLLRDEHKLINELPTLALPVKEMDKKIQEEITAMMLALDWDLRKKLSEVALSEEQELTMILSLDDQPLSVFLGKEEWEIKISKLEKIISHLQRPGNKRPNVINMTNSKKIVVKFNQNL